MKNLDNKATDATAKKPLEYTVEGVEYTTTDEYKTGAELKTQRGIPLDVDLYLKIPDGYDDELIPNDKEVNLARPKEEFFYVKDKYDFFLNEVKHTSFKPVVTGKELLLSGAIMEVNCYDLYQKFKGGDFEKISLDERVDLTNAGVEKFITKDTETFTYTVNGEHEMVDQKVQTPLEILTKAGFDSDEYYLVQVLEDGSKKIYAYIPNEEITMSCKGLVFEALAWLEVVDVEEYGKQCKEIPPAKSYKVKIQNGYHIFTSRYTSPEEIIKVAGTPGKQYDVKKFVNGNPMPINIPTGTKIDLTETCLIRFILQPCEQQAGYTGRRTFDLPETDVEFLNDLGLPWETLSPPGRWLLINNFPIPEGYNVSTATVALSIDPSYPGSQIDMAYFYPPLSRNDKRGIRALASQSIDGKNFQRWSRHRACASEWVMGVDCIATHLSLVTNWLNRELKL